MGAQGLDKLVVGLFPAASCSSELVASTDLTMMDSSDATASFRIICQEPSWKETFPRAPGPVENATAAHVHSWETEATTAFNGLSSAQVLQRCDTILHASLRTHTEVYELKV